MKSILLLSLLALSTRLFSQDGSVSIPQPAAPTADSLMPNQRAFLNLPEESRKDFVKHLEESGRLFQQKRVFETLDELEKTAKIFKDSPEIYNLRGSCFVEMRAFEKALDQFKQADALSKNNPSIEFNIAEVYFCTKEWKKSLEILEKIFKAMPPENIALSRLVEFKIMLCKKKLGQKDEALILSKKYDFLDDSPFYYYAEAAMAYDADNLIKAEEWLAIAGRVFQDPNVLAPWQDTMVEYGYIKSFYGEDPAAAEK
jgi:tetratricopeptide (TPR) repeat protein